MSLEKSNRCLLIPNPLLTAYYIPSGNDSSWQNRISAENITARLFGVINEVRRSYFRRNEGGFSRGSNVWWIRGLKVEIRRRFLVTRNIYRFPQGWLLWYGMSKKLVLQGAQGWCTGVTLRDGMGREVGRSSGWRTHVHPCLIHVNVWQKPLQYCNSPPIKINKWIKKKKKKKMLRCHS